MASIDDASQVEKIIRSKYPYLSDPKPYKIKVRKQGITWIATYMIPRLNGDEKHEIRINAHTGKVIKDE
jgi:hypothetical protein